MPSSSTHRLPAASARAASDDRSSAQPAEQPDARITGLAAEIRRHVILFVGSGISAALGVPTWEGFIGRLGEDLGYSPQDFLALSDDFRSLAEFYRLERGSLELLCERMLEEWQVSDEALRRSPVHEMIVRLDFPLVYTTNYDSLLERSYRLEGRNFNKVVTARDIATSDPSLPTIVKFHGDLEVPSSLVLAETDYLRRLSFEQPLDIKLAADAFGRAVLFVGYSVSDINLRLLLFRLHAIWRATGCETARPRSYVLVTQPNRVQERILDSWGVTPVTVASDDETTAVASFLKRLCAPERAVS